MSYLNGKKTGLKEGFYNGKKEHILLQIVEYDEHLERILLCKDEYKNMDDKEKCLNKNIYIKLKEKVIKEYEENYGKYKEEESKKI
jgi:hypothetical protein